MNNKIAEINVSYFPNVLDSYPIYEPKKAFEYFLSNWNLDTIQLYEEFKILFLNRANQILGIYNLSKGGSSETVVDFKILFGITLKCGASAIILCHNHPSGKLVASDSDIKLTRKVKKAGDILGIQILDHLIISDKGFISLNEYLF